MRRAAGLLSLVIVLGAAAARAQGSLAGTAAVDGLRTRAARGGGGVARSW